MSTALRGGPSIVSCLGVRDVCAMCKVVNFRHCQDPRDVIHEAVHALAEGHLVGLPTETSYVLAAHGLQGAAVQALRQLAGTGMRGEGEASVEPAQEDPRSPIGETAVAPCALTVKGMQEAVDYVPHLSPLGRKLARRCWPGPVTLIFPAPQNEGLLYALPAETRASVVCRGEVHIRVPAYEAVQEVLKLMPAPLVTSTESLPEGRPLGTVADLQTFLKGSGVHSPQCPVSLIVDDGPCRYEKPSTVVRVSEDDWTLVREGIVSETVLRRLAAEVYVFVCTGNTCRSPLAEGLFRKMMSERLQCREEELFDRGFVVVSAGLAAGQGAPASPEAIEIAARKGVDLRTHVSQPLTDRLIHQADHVYTMTQAHLNSVVSTWPEVSDRVGLLARDQTDISDPMGGGLSDYERCEQEIQSHVRALVEAVRIP